MHSRVRKATARKKETTEDRLNGLFSFYRQFSQFCKVKKRNRILTKFKRRRKVNETKHGSCRIPVPKHTRYTLAFLTLRKTQLFGKVYQVYQAPNPSHTTQYTFSTATKQTHNLRTARKFTRKLPRFSGLMTLAPSVPTWNSRNSARNRPRKPFWALSRIFYHPRRKTA